MYILNFRERVNRSFIEAHIVRTKKNLFFHKKVDRTVLEGKHHPILPCALFEMLTFRHAYVRLLGKLSRDSTHHATFVVP